MAAEKMTVLPGSQASNPFSRPSPAEGKAGKLYDGKSSEMKNPLAAWEKRSGDPRPSDINHYNGIHTEESVLEHN